MALRTRAASQAPSASAPAGRAWVGSCDGQGAFIVFVALDNPDGWITLANLCIRAAADIRSGFALVRQRQTDVDEILAQARDGGFCAFAEITLAEAAAVVERARERTRSLGIRIPEEAIPALDLLDPCQAIADALTDAAEDAADVSLEEVRRLLLRHEYRAWFFDPGDLAGVGVSPPKGRAPDPEWLAAAARHLDTRALRDRVTSMAHHMARFHAWADEKNESRLLAALARMTATNFAKSLLVRAMLERSAGAAGREMEREVSRFGDPDLRDHLRRSFYLGVRKATAIKLAGLDFTEAALVAIEAVLPQLPGELRPRDETREQIAHALGRTFADAVLRAAADRAPLEPEELGRTLHAEVVRTSGLSDPYAELVAASAETGLVSFFSEVCTACPVQCFARAGEDLSAAFFAPVHPARLKAR